MRSTLASIGFGLAAALLWTQVARAQEECRADADCGDGRRCEKPVSIDGCAEPPCDDVRPEVGEVGWCVPAALNMVCTSDADCGDELECVSYEGRDKPCASDEPECSTSSSAAESRCEYPPPEPLLCDDGDSCAPPFACDTEMDEPACYYPDQTCETDGDCAADFDCVAGADLAFDDCQECDKGDGSGEPVCRSVPCEPGPNQCSPKLIACEADADCPDQWLCREIGYDYKAAQWGDDVLGTQACVPGGLVQVAEGNYYLGGFVTLDGAADSGAAAQSGVAKGGRDDAADGDDKPSRASADDEGIEPKADSGGCAVALPRQATANGLGLLASGLLALALRRRRPEN